MLTTQVFDTTQGRFADGLPVALEQHTGEAWEHIGGGVTEEDGSIDGLLPEGEDLERGTYRLTFDTGTYFAANALSSPLPVVRVVFEVARDGERLHLPLALSPHGYSTQVVSALG